MSRSSWRSLTCARWARPRTTICWTASARPQAIRVQYQDPEGGTHVLEAGGWFARVILHEYDHLQGKLFIDYFSPRDHKKTAGPIKDLLAQTEKIHPGPLAL